MPAPICSTVHSESDLTTLLYGIKSIEGRRVVDTYETAKNLSKLLKPLLDAGQKSAKAISKQDAGAAVKAFGAYVSTAQYVSKLADWDMAAKLFQQSAKTLGFLKAFKLATPSRQATAVGLLASEKILLQFGLVSKSQGLKCGTALATLAADGVALAVLGTATGGIGLAFFAISFAWSVVDAGYQCAQLLDK
jgi:hypothetical protein